MAPPSAVIRRDVLMPSIGTRGVIDWMGSSGDYSGGQVEFAQGAGGTGTIFSRNDGPKALIQDGWLHELSVSPTHLGLPLVGIGVSPESHICQCGVAISETLSEYRVISPGNPLFLESVPSARTVQVFMRQPLPPIPTAGNQTHFWDGVKSPGDASQVTAALWGIPLRLELYYGIVPPRSFLRHPLHARARVLTPLPAAASDTSFFYVCIEGRKRIDVSILTTANNVNAAASIIGVYGLNTSSIAKSKNVTLNGPFGLAADTFFRLAALQSLPPVLLVRIDSGVVVTQGDYTIIVDAYDEAEPQFA